MYGRSIRKCLIKYTINIEIDSMNTHIASHLAPLLGSGRLLSLSSLAHRRCISPLTNLKEFKPLRRFEPYANTCRVGHSPFVAQALPADQTDSSTDDDHYMHLALEEAHRAAAAGEVPVGAVLISSSGEVLSSAGNAIETSCDPTAHAEMLCIRRAAGAAEAWRLPDATLYVTLEPCPMCAGAVLQSRLRRLVYGASNPLLGAAGSWVDIISPSRPHPFHPDLRVTRGVLADECSDIMKDFFKKRRENCSRRN
jgi:tRNA(adenine34) deaminase